jgi:hypothetical protein
VSGRVSVSGCKAVLIEAGGATVLRSEGDSPSKRTIGTARGTTHGSCRPRAMSSFAVPSRNTAARSSRPVA